MPGTQAWLRTVRFSRGLISFYNRQHGTLPFLQHCVVFLWRSTHQTPPFYAFGFVQVRVSDSRQRLCRPDGCINTGANILFNEIIICILCLGSTLECLGMQTLLGKCYKSEQASKFTNFMQFFFSHHHSKLLLRKNNLENHT